MRGSSFYGGWLIGYAVVSLTCVMIRRFVVARTPGSAVPAQRDLTPEDLAYIQLGKEHLVLVVYARLVLADAARFAKPGRLVRLGTDAPDSVGAVAASVFRALDPDLPTPISHVVRRVPEIADSMDRELVAAGWLIPALLHSQLQAAELIVLLTVALAFRANGGGTLAWWMALVAALQTVSFSRRTSASRYSALKQLAFDRSRSESDDERQLWKLAFGGSIAWDGREELAENLRWAVNEDSGP